MPLGIGGGGWAGLAFEVLPPPVATSATAIAGGSLTAGTYKYYITAINAAGETTVSNELTGTTSAGNLTLTILWAAVTGATGYKIYRTAIGGASNSELLLATVGAVTTYNDAATGAPAGALPTVNTANAPGTYTAPTKWFSFNTENLKKVQDTVWRRPIRMTVDVAGAVPGNVHIEGDLEQEVFEDIIPYFLYCARGDIVKSGSNPNFVYTFTPNANATPARTMSLTVQRTNGAIFGYTGVVVSQMKWSIDNGELMVAWSLLGSDETTGSGSPSFPNSTPFGAGMYDVEIPVGTQVFDTDTFEFNIDDAGASQFRMKNNGRGAQFIAYGERTTTLQLERDFVDKTEYNDFVAYTAKDITILASKGTNNSVKLEMPVATIDTYEVGLSGQGDLVRATVNYQGVRSASGAYSIVVKTQENI
jgi:hypothetical protein